MEQVLTNITSFIADDFFGRKEYAYVLEDRNIEAVLRYIALKDADDNIEKINNINPVVLLYDEYKTGNDYAAQTNSELMILITKGCAKPFEISSDGWTSLDKAPYPVAPFLSKFSDTKIYINPSAKKAIVAVKTATTRWKTAFCSSIFRILPWRFEKITDEDLNLFRSINENDTEKFVEIINNLVSRFDFEKARIRKLLYGWGDRGVTTLIANEKRKYEQTLEQLRDLEISISECLNKIDSHKVRIAELESRPDSDKNEVSDFFISHKALGVYECSKGTNNILRYFVLETIEYYDVDEFKRAYNNHRSCVGEASNDIRQILYSIFAENKGKFRVESRFELVNLSSLKAMRGTTERFSGEYLPHPHLAHYACLGENGNYINKYMQDGDWDLAIEQSISATKNINFGDATVVSSFISDLRNRWRTCKCIIADNDVAMTPEEFYNYINTCKAQEE